MNNRQLSEFMFMHHLKTPKQGAPIQANIKIYWRGKFYVTRNVFHKHGTSSYTGILKGSHWVNVLGIKNEVLVSSLKQPIVRKTKAEWEATRFDPKCFNHYLTK